MVSRLEYLEHFLDSVDFVSSGKKGEISNDKWLVVNYQSGFYSVIEKYLKSTDDRVRAEVVMLLTSLRERAAMDIVKEMRIRDNERVSTACLGYITTMGDEDGLIPSLIETMEFKRGIEFRKAAERIGVIGRSNDLRTLRKIYGQVDGDMRVQVKDAMTKIIDRDEELKRKKDLLLSVPVFPDEKRFEKFLNSSEEYLDVRYRNSVHPKTRITVGTYNNIVRGMRDMRVRLFNESENLQDYSPEYTERYNGLVDLLDWAVDDLATKEVVHTSAESNISCSRCGSPMLFGNGEWRCLDCGNKK